MPVRKIPKSFRSVTGRFPSVLNGRCIGCESRLEQEFYLKLEFDRTVRKYEEQPFKISGEVDGNKISYTPDCLINYLNGQPDRFVDVKFQSEVDEHDKGMEARFTLARNYAIENGLVFDVVTDVLIRDTALDNYRLIYRFAKPPNNFETKKEYILKVLDLSGALILKDLMPLLAKEQMAQSVYKNTIWHLLYTGEIVTDFNRKIDNNTLLRIADGKDNIP